MEFYKKWQERLSQDRCQACKNVKRLSNVIEIFKSFRLPHSGKSFFQQHIYGYELDVKTLSSNIGIIGSQSFDVQNYMPSHFHLLAITSKAINMSYLLHCLYCWPSQYEKWSSVIK